MPNYGNAERHGFVNQLYGLSQMRILIGIVRAPGTSLERSAVLNTAMERTLLAEFPDEITIGLSDEQYIRNVAATLFRRASV